MTGVDLNLLDIEISGCKAANKGGAIYASEVNVNMADLKFSDNSAANGGALAFDNVMTAQLYRSRCILCQSPLKTQR